jgi:pyruvate,orthophosphate dikinase
MLGHRGCRLAVSYPEIAEMQARAIFEAAVEAAGARPARRSCRKIMVPLVGLKAELDFVKARIDQVAAVMAETGVEDRLSVGTMIELPRAACAPMSSPRRPSSSPSAPTT